MRTPLLIALAACSPRLEESEVGHMRLLSADVDMHRSGQRDIRIPVEGGETSLLATFQPNPPFVGHVLSLSDPNDTRHFDAVSEANVSQSKTNAGFLGPAASLNWPVLSSDPTLVEGQWTLEVGVADSDGFYAREQARLDVLLKSDDDLTTGTLRVALVFAGKTAEDTALVEDTRTALDYWSTLYGRFGITIDAVELQYPEGNLEPPGAGSTEHYMAIAEQTGIGVLNIVIVESIPGIDSVYGVAGDIPGPLVPSPRTAVLVSVEDARGPDGAFDDTELRIYGETLAHETGHLLGLFHPVETTLDVWDALPDTPECSSERQCTNKLGENLMFPYPVCTFIDCTPQTILTPEQALVAHRYVGVD